MLIEVGIQKSKIITDNPDILAALYNKYAFKVKGAEYTPSFRSRRWDGKKRFITRNGIFRSGLLSRVLRDLQEAGVRTISQEGINLLPDSGLDFMHRRPVGKLKYRDYQDKAIYESMTWATGVIKSPTGAGKTLIMAGIWHNLNQPKSVFLFSTKLLASQTYKFFQAQGFEDIGICTGEGYIPANTMFCTYQSLDKILDTHLESARAIFVDECHEFCNGDVTLEVIRSFPNAKYRFGFSATPPREGKEDIALFNLEGALGPVREYKKTKELIDEGLLSKPIIHMIDVPRRGLDILDEDMTYPECYDEFIVNCDVRNKMIHQIVGLVAIEDFMKKRQSRVLILVKSLEHVQVLAKLLPESIVLEGKDSLDTRYVGIDKFLNAKHTSVLIATKILQNGISIDEITHFINARGLKSNSATIQALGRSLRRPKGQDQVYVYDFYDDRKYLGAHSKGRQKTYIDEGHMVKSI